jgi:hypothetical protein
LVVAPAERHDVRCSGSVDGRELPELAFGQGRSVRHQGTRSELAFVPSGRPMMFTDPLRPVWLPTWSVSKARCLGIA